MFIMTLSGYFIMNILELNHDKESMYLDISDENEDVQVDAKNSITRMSKYHKKKVVNPISKNWDVLKFISFLSYMPDNFHSEGVKRSKVPGFMRKIVVFENNNVIIELLTDDLLEKFQVNLVRYTNWIQVSQGAFITFFVKKVLMKDIYPKNHPYQVFGSFFGRTDKATSQIVWLIFRNVFKKPGKFKVNDSSLNSFIDFLGQLPGFVEIVYDHSGDGYVFDSNEQKTMQKLVWVCSWAKSRIEYTQYMELDASFEALRPYTYCCINSIINNESVPIALSVGKKENFDLYEAAYLLMEKSGISGLKLNSIPVLSDMGKALISFCRSRNIDQYFCHKHLIDHFGHPLLKLWCKRLVETLTEEEYNSVSIQISAEIRIWCSQHNEEEIPPRLVDLYVMLNYDSDTSSNYHVKKWALWERASIHMGRCSNHSESLHSVFNRKCCCYRNFYQQMTRIVNIIIQKLSNEDSTHGRSIRSKFWELKHQYNHIQHQKYLDISKFNKEKCNCGWKHYYCQLFGVDFPCIHEIGGKVWKQVNQLPINRHVKLTNFQL